MRRLIYFYVGKGTFIVPDASENWREEPHKGFEHPSWEGAGTPFGRSYASAVAHVAEEHGLEPGVEFGRVYQHIGLEIMFEAAEIEIGGADGAEIVVDDYGLAVEHPFLIEIDFYPGAQAVHDIGI